MEKFTSILDVKLDFDKITGLTGGDREAYIGKIIANKKLISELLHCVLWEFHENVGKPQDNPRMYDWIGGSINGIEKALDMIDDLQAEVTQAAEDQEENKI